LDAPLYALFASSPSGYRASAKPHHITSILLLYLLLLLIMEQIP
jgi:hypothetical protein